jgi:hypothetical protein
MFQSTQNGTPGLQPHNVPSPALVQTPMSERAPRPVAVVDEPLTLTFPQGTVHALSLTHAGTGFHKTIAYVAAAFALIAFVVSTAGMGLFALIAAPIAEKFRWRKVHARIRASGVHVTSEQMPFIHKTVVDFARRLGMKEIPEVYVVEDTVQNGVALKLGKKNMVLLTDDVVWGALQSKDPRALGFVIGHELAHVALGHTGTVRSLLSNVFKPLARDDEYTADNVATALVGDREIAVHGITVLTVGPQLLPFINERALAEQAKEMWRDKHAKKAERMERHPFLLRRVANALGVK